MQSYQLTRRNFLQLTALATGSTLLAACTPALPAASDALPLLPAPVEPAAACAGWLAAIPADAGTPVELQAASEHAIAVHGTLAPY